MPNTTRPIVEIIAGGTRGPQGDQGEQGIQGVPGVQGVPGNGVTIGGTTGQFLAKASNSNYDTTWNTLNQAAVAGLTVSDSPIFSGFQLLEPTSGIKLTGFRTNTTGDLVINPVNGQMSIDAFNRDPFTTLTVYSITNDGGISVIAPRRPTISIISQTSGGYGTIRLAGGADDIFQIGPQGPVTTVSVGFGAISGSGGYLDTDANTVIVQNVGVRFAHLADSAAQNDTTYYSTTGSKLSYKDSGGTVHALY